MRPIRSAYRVGKITLKTGIDKKTKIDSPGIAGQCVNQNQLFIQERSSRCLILRRIVFPCPVLSTDL